MSPPPRIRYKAGHPRFNVFVLLVLLTVFLAIALYQAQRLAIP